MLLDQYFKEHLTATAAIIGTLILPQLLNSLTNYGVF